MTALPDDLGLSAFLGSLTGIRGTAEALPETLESRLIRRAQAGDTAAFRSLVESHQNLIYRLCVSCLLCEDDAAEVAQDAFLRAWQALPAWEPRARFSRKPISNRVWRGAGRRAKLAT